MLAITNGSSTGVPDETKIPVYRDFVHDLHMHLAAKNLAISYTAGYSRGRYQIVFVCAIALGLNCVGLPLAMLLITSDTRLLALVIAGGFLCWPLGWMVRNNAPRIYAPDRLPLELLR